MLEELNDIPGVNASIRLDIDKSRISPELLTRMQDALAGLPYCDKCGCTENSACPGGCSSAGEPGDLCSACTEEGD